jgi:hypothetical protein
VRQLPVDLPRFFILSALDDFVSDGGVAQMVERSLSMREVRGSIPCASTSLFHHFASLCILRCSLVQKNSSKPSLNLNQITIFYHEERDIKTI